MRLSDQTQNRGWEGWVWKQHHLPHSTDCFPNSAMDNLVQTTVWSVDNKNRKPGTSSGTNLCETVIALGNHKNRSPVPQCFPASPHERLQGKKGKWRGKGRNNPVSHTGRVLNEPVCLLTGVSLTEVPTESVLPLRSSCPFTKNSRELSCYYTISALITEKWSALMIKRVSGIPYPEHYLSQISILTNLVHESRKAFCSEKWSFVEIVSRVCQCTVLT